MFPDTTNKPQPIGTDRNKQKFQPCTEAKQWTVEEKVCLFVWSAVVFYLFVAVTYASSEYQTLLNSREYLKPSRFRLWRFRDASDFEWEYGIELILNLCPWLLGHIVAFNCSDVYPSCKKIVLIGYYSVVFVYLFGWKAALVLLLQCLTIYLTALTCSTLLVWCVLILLIFGLNVDFILHVYSLALDERSPYTADMFVLSTAMMYLRSISFSMELLWYKKKKSVESTESVDCTDAPGEPASNHVQPATPLDYSFIDMLLYSFYLPRASEHSLFGTHSSRFEREDRA